MTRLDFFWWVGMAYFVAWTALPLLGVPLLGVYLGVSAWLLIAPWSALAGMALLHRVLPRSQSGVFRMFSDRGSIHWAVRGWAPSLFLTVFQRVLFLSHGFQRMALLAFGAELGPGAQVTSRTIIREPHHVQIGAGSLVGEFAHLVCSYQLRPGLLLVGQIHIGDHVLIGAHSQLGPGVQVGSNSILESSVTIGGRTVVGTNCRIGSGTRIYNSVRIGKDVRIGKGCLIPTRSVIADSARLPDGTVWSEDRIGSTDE